MRPARQKRKMQRAVIKDNFSFSSSWAHGVRCERRLLPVLPGRKFFLSFSSPWAAREVICARRQKIALDYEWEIGLNWSSCYFQFSHTHTTWPRAFFESHLFGEMPKTAKESFRLVCLMSAPKYYLSLAHSQTRRQLVCQRPHQSKVTIYTRIMTSCRLLSKKKAHHHWGMWILGQ